MDIFHFPPFSKESNSFETDFSNSLPSNNSQADLIENPFSFHLIQEFHNEEDISLENNIFNSKKNLPNICMSTKCSSDPQKNKFSVLIHKKRGRRNVKDKYTNLHDKFKHDNIIRKIQVSYINFITDFVNIILKKVAKDLCFIPLDYSYKGKVDKDFRLYLKNNNIGELLSNKSSPKFRSKDQDINKVVYNKIKKENIYIISELLNKKCFFFFEKIYYKNKRKFNLNEFGFNDLEIELPASIQLFNNLILKNKKEIGFSKYKEKLEYCARKFFLEKGEDIFKCNYA